MCSLLIISCLVINTCFVFAYLELNQTVGKKHTNVKQSLKIVIVVIDNCVIELIPVIGY